jgi:hypothetical protein
MPKRCDWKNVSTCLFLMLSLLTIPTAVGLCGAQSPASNPKEEVAKLLAVLRDPDLRRSHPEQVVAAIDRLGEMHASEAVEDLVKLLTFAQKFDWESPDQKAIVEIQLIHTGNRYPATSALFQIGQPALLALLKVIESDSASSLRRQNALFTIRNIFRDNPSEGVKYLNHAAQTSVDRPSAERLTEAAVELARPAQ